MRQHKRSLISIVDTPRTTLDFMFMFQIFVSRLNDTLESVTIVLYN